jgi:uncharacterized protein YndB with AHSA1/START domain
MSTDRIEKQIVLRAPRSRVWQALTTAGEFGRWFGARLDGAAFAPGAQVEGPITIAGYEAWVLAFTVERMEPEHLFSYRWHPHTAPGQDHGGEPTTLVEFRLEEVPGGTRLTVVESGFDRLPAARRATALGMNDPGWAAQLQNLARHAAP